MQPFIIRITLLALITLLSACSHCNKQTTGLQRVYYNTWERDIGYAQVVREGNRLYVSGIASDAKDFDSQLQEIYSNISKILADNHLDTSAILKETIYTTDIEALKKAIPLRKTFYPKGEFPSASWVQVTRLFMPGQLIEVELEILFNTH